MSRIGLTHALMLLLAATLPAQDKTNGSNDKAAKKEARAALAAAGRLARIPRGTPDVERRNRLARVLEQFAGVERRFGEMPVIAAEAAFRQGQILGRLLRTDDATAAFRRSADLAPEAFGARALLEAGHVLRRQKSYTEAVASYRRAVEKKGGRYSDRARLWLGKTLVRLGRLSDARREWQALGADGRADGYVRIQAFDELAMTYVREKKIDEAKRVIREADDTLAVEVSGESKKAKRLKGSLERMRARKKIGG